MAARARRRRRVAVRLPGRVRVPGPRGSRATPSSAHTPPWQIWIRDSRWPHSSQVATSPKSGSWPTTAIEASGRWPRSHARNSSGLLPGTSAGIRTMSIPPYSLAMISAVCMARSRGLDPSTSIDRKTRRSTAAACFNFFRPTGVSGRSASSFSVFAKSSLSSAMP